MTDRKRNAKVMRNVDADGFFALLTERFAHLKLNEEGVKRLPVCSAAFEPHLAGKYSQHGSPVSFIAENQFCDVTKLRASFNRGFGDWSHCRQEVK